MLCSRCEAPSLPPAVRLASCAIFTYLLAAAFLELFNGQTMLPFDQASLSGFPLPFEADQQPCSMRTCWEPCLGETFTVHVVDTEELKEKVSACKTCGHDRKDISYGASLTFTEEVW
jgi:hypothetical protein